MGGSNDSTDSLKTSSAQRTAVKSKKKDKKKGRDTSRGLRGVFNAVKVNSRKWSLEEHDRGAYQVTEVLLTEWL
jgi:hypothetical protein